MQAIDQLIQPNVERILFEMLPAVHRGQQFKTFAVDIGDGGKTHEESNRMRRELAEAVAKRFNREKLKGFWREDGAVMVEWSFPTDH